jgi:hypothetical protein
VTARELSFQRWCCTHAVPRGHSSTVGSTVDYCRSPVILVWCGRNHAAIRLRLHLAYIPSLVLLDVALLCLRQPASVCGRSRTLDSDQTSATPH